MVRWIASFLSERETFVSLEGERSKPLTRETGIPQGSPLSPILYLFYNADLLELCHDPRSLISSSGYADDINIYIFGPTTKDICEALAEVHGKCQESARRHCSKFARAKYELLHLSNNPGRYNMEEELIIDEVHIQSKENIRILGMQMDSRLNWKTHLKQTAIKTRARIGALKCITASTWGATLRTARKLYIATIRPVILFGVAAWLRPNRKGEFPRGQLNCLESLQGQALRVVNGAFRCTAFEALDVETYTTPIRIRVKQALQDSLMRLATSGKRRIIEQAVDEIRNYSNDTRSSSRRWKRVMDDSWTWLEKTTRCRPSAE